MQKQTGRYQQKHVSQLESKISNINKSTGIHNVNYIADRL
jgi:hypothetical protein